MFIVSGGEKLLSPYQNFLYVLEGYDILAVPLDEIVARVFPWVEFLIGIFMLLGLWTEWAIRGSLLLFTVFIGIISQALIRGIPLDECGCFGELISIPPHITLIMDCCFWALLAWMLMKLEATSKLSLDEYFSKTE